MSVIIMRGLPGSGKSSWHKQYHPNAFVFSTDDEFMINGIWTFDKTKLAINHDKTLVKYTRHIAQYRGGDIVVDNTNIKVWEIAPYYRIAEAFGLNPQITQVQANPEDCILRNTHGVPAETIYMMAKSFEPLPPWWNIKWIN